MSRKTTFSYFLIVFIKKFKPVINTQGRGEQSLPLGRIYGIEILHECVAEEAKDMGLA